MSIDPDYLMERKKIKKQLIKWKIFFFIGLVLFLFFLSSKHNPASYIIAGKNNDSDHIAGVRIEEIIIDNLDKIKKLEEIGKNDKVKALIVNINSPGGSVVGSEMYYNALLKISKTKPVVAVMHSLAASGGYLTALGADYIVAHNGTLTGSIGVIMQTAEITEIAEKLGIKFENFKSDLLKGSPNPTEKITLEARQVTMESIYQVHEYFVQQVAVRRKLDLAQARMLSDGRIYSGRQALDLKLIDAIGDHDTALQWLYDKGISRDLQIIDTNLNVKEKLIDILLEDFQLKLSNIFSPGSIGFKSLFQN